jgi:hypothetical protein
MFIPIPVHHGAIDNFMFRVKLVATALLCLAVIGMVGLVTAGAGTKSDPFILDDPQEFRGIRLLLSQGFSGPDSCCYWGRRAARSACSEPFSPKGFG